MLLERLWLSRMSHHGLIWQVTDPSLNDIKLALDPDFHDVSRIDDNLMLSHDVYGSAYMPGFVGMNNLTRTDYLSVGVQALAHVKPLRNFFLVASNVADCDCPIVQRFAELMRKIWSPHNFKSAVAPHEFMNEVSRSSKKRFQTGKQAEAADFIAWLLNSLHRGLTKKKWSRSHTSRKRSIITDTFQGVVRVQSKPLTAGTVRCIKLLL